MKADKRLNDVVRLCATGVFVTVCAAVLEIGFGARTLNAGKAWQLGVSQPYVAGAVFLVALSLLWYRGASWTRWPILLWPTVVILAGSYWVQSQEVGSVDKVFIGGVVLIEAAWGWGAYRVLFPNSRLTEVPRIWLLAPSLGFAIMVAIFFLISYTVPGYRPVHGEGGVLLFVLALVMLVIVGIMEIFAVSIAIFALVRAPELRTPANFASVAVGAAPLVPLWFFYGK